MIARTREEAEGLLQVRISMLCAAAFAAGARLAVKVDPIPTRDQRSGEIEFEFKHRAIGPGESAPRGWTIFENRSGIAVGRSA